MRDLRPPLAQQILMRDFMDATPHAGIFASPGLGKSRATIDSLRSTISDGASKGALIISPKRVNTLTWPAECKKWEPDFIVANLRTPEGMKRWDEGSAHIYTCNQEFTQQLVERAFKGRRKLPVDTLILDELTKFKNPSSKRGRALMPYLKHFDRRIGLTGTPTPNGYADLFAQIRLLDLGQRFGTSFHEFRRRFFDHDYMEYNFWLKEGAKEKIEGIISDMVITLRSKEWMAIPPVAVEDIEIAMPPEITKQYLALEKDMLLKIGPTQEVVAPTAAALITKLRQFTGGAVFTTDEENPAKRCVTHVHDAKIDALNTAHVSIKRAPMLVGTQFTHETARILKAFPYAEAFDERSIDRWNNGEIPMFVADSASISHGLNLQGPCNHVFWFSLPYNYDSYDQFNCRIARTGQTKPTTIWRCLVNDSIDWAVCEVLRSKETEQNHLLAALVYLQAIAANRT